MKNKLTLKSLADLPANTLALATSMPRRTLVFSKQLLAGSKQSAQQHISDVRSHSLAVMQDIYHRANAPFRSIYPWTRGGLNE